MNIPFNKPYFSGKEADNLTQAATSGHISGNGFFTQKCHSFFTNRYGFQKVLLTTSCTDALEMSAILLNIQEGDEVICPSYAFVSTANAFVLKGAKIIFADSEDDNPNIDANRIEELITSKTKAIIVIHYGGVACDMDKIMDIANRNNIFVVEDAAQSIDGYYNNKALGSIGHLATFSFHETKNIISGEGGMLVINDDRFIERSEIIWEKGTNRAAFFRGEVDKYGWVDIGSSFLPSELISSFLYAQLESIDFIQNTRKKIWNYYYSKLQDLEKTGIAILPNIPNYSSNNAHLFYILTNSLQERTEFLRFLNNKGIKAVFHYLPLHQSPYYNAKHDGRELPNAVKFSQQIVRLPFFNDITTIEQNFIIDTIFEFYSRK